MTSDQLLLLVLCLVIAAPALLLLGVILGVGATSLFAAWRGRAELPDELQAQVFAARPQHGLSGWSSGVVLEGWWQSVAFVLQGIHMVRRFRTPDLQPTGGPVVVLVAGYLENGGQMWPLARRLAARGYQPTIVDLPSTLHRVERNVEFLAEAVEQARARAGADRVALVGHSMGGVIARTYVRCRAEAPVATVISIGSPHRGTLLAHLGIGESARDMCPGSEHVRRFPPATGGVSVHTVISAWDNIVSPAWSTVIGEGDDLLLSEPVGHVAPLFLRSVEERVSGWLLAAEWGADAARLPAAPVTAEGVRAGLEPA